MITIDKSLQGILQTLESGGHHAYFVGGFVRDGLDDVCSFDVDIATSAPIETMDAYFNQEDQYYQHAYGVCFKHGAYTIEITRMRRESYTHQKRHPSELEWTDVVAEDALRRDFTINALYYNLDSGLIDPIGGLKDLKHRCLRFIGNPKQRILEDPLRILRFIRFQAEHGFTGDDAAHQAVLMHKALVADVASVHLRKEIERIVCGVHFIRATTRYAEVLSVCFPKIAPTLGFDQHHPFHNMNLYDHMIHVVHHCRPDTRLKMAALFHDIAKPDVCVRTENVWHYPHHALKSSEIAHTYYTMLGYSQKDIIWMCDLIKHHGDHLEPTFQEFQMLISKKGVAWTLDLIELKRADNLSKSDRAQYQVIRCRQFREIVLEIVSSGMPKELKDLNVNGNDLLVHGAKAKTLGLALESLFEAVVYQKVENNKKSLIAYWMEVLK